MSRDLVVLAMAAIMTVLLILVCRLTSLPEILDGETVEAIREIELNHNKMEVQECPRNYPERNSE